mgnify:CR=1 FL=1
MRGGFIDGIGRASFKTDLPEPKIVSPEDVKIRVRSTGICGSEVHAQLEIGRASCRERV